MDFKVIFTETFCDDLERILTYIAERNPIAARKLGTLVVDACEALTFFPERNPTVRQRPRYSTVNYSEALQSLYRIKPKTRRWKSSVAGMPGEDLIQRRSDQQETS